MSELSGQERDEDSADDDERLPDPMTAVEADDDGTPTTAGPDRAGPSGADGSGAGATTGAAAAGPACGR